MQLFGKYHSTSCFVKACSRFDSVVSFLTAVTPSNVNSLLVVRESGLINTIQRLHRTCTQRSAEPGLVPRQYCSSMQSGNEASSLTCNPQLPELIVPVIARRTHLTRRAYRCQAAKWSTLSLRRIPIIPPSPLFRLETKSDNVRIELLSLMIVI